MKFLQGATLRKVILVVSLALTVCGAAAQPPKRSVASVARPGTASLSQPGLGLSSERLARLSAFLRQGVEQGEVPGVVVLLLRDGKPVYFEAFGMLDREAGRPLDTQALFRIASQTKAVTSVAAMMLVEEGQLLLADPVSKFVPAFVRTSVFVPAKEPGGEATLVPAARPITVRDLLTHTSGISYGWGPLQARYEAARALGWYCADKDEAIGAEIERLAGLPFEAQPGEKFVYGFSTDILGYVVERVSGQDLDTFFRERIFAPLGMRDTFFYVPADKAARLATVYSIEKPGAPLVRAPDGGYGQGDYVTGPRRCFSGGAGLVSTAADYARFLELLRRGGELDGTRLLSPKTVELMTSNHLGAIYSQGNRGFGLGFEVTEHVGRSGRYGSVGLFEWGGAYHTKYWVDPAERLVAVLMTQINPGPNWEFQDRFRSLVYQAIVD